MTKVAIPFLDASNEGSTARMYVADAIGDAAITALFNAVVGVTLGNAQKSVLESAIDKDAGTTGAPANQFAQREIKWLVKATDNVTGKNVTFSLPCADLDQLVAGSELLDIGVGTPGETLVNAINAIVLSDVGNAITVNSIQHVGRNT